MIKKAFIIIISEVRALIYHGDPRRTIHEIWIYEIIRTIKPSPASVTGFTPPETEERYCIWSVGFCLVLVSRAYFDSTNRWVWIFDLGPQLIKKLGSLELKKKEIKKYLLQDSFSLSIMTEKRTTLRPKSARYGCRPSSILSSNEDNSHISSATVHHPTSSHHIFQENATLTTSSSENGKGAISEEKGRSPTTSEQATSLDNIPKKTGSKIRNQISNNGSRKSKSESRSNSGCASTEHDLLPFCNSHRHAEVHSVPFENVLSASSQKVLDKLKDRQKALSGVSQAMVTVTTSDNSSQNTNYNSRKLQPLCSSSRLSHGHPCFQ